MFHRHEFGNIRGAERLSVDDLPSMGIDDLDGSSFLDVCGDAASCRNAHGFVLADLGARAQHLCFLVARLRRATGSLEKITASHANPINQIGFIIRISNG